MSYKTPLVVKEVYLPIDYSDDGITIEQYKEKYGIDLYDVLIIKKNKDGNTYDIFPKSICKIYLIVPVVILDGLDASGAVCVVPVGSASKKGENKHVLQYSSSDEAYKSYCGLGIDYSDATNGPIVSPFGSGL